MDLRSRFVLWSAAEGSRRRAVLRPSRLRARDGTRSDHTCLPWRRAERDVGSTKYRWRKAWSSGMLHKIQANDLAICWNSKAGKCGSCSAEVGSVPGSPHGGTHGKVWDCLPLLRWQSLGCFPAARVFRRQRLRGYLLWCSLLALLRLTWAALCIFTGQTKDLYTSATAVGK